MTLLRRTVAEGSTLERWLRRKAAIGNITKGDSLYLCGHGETAPLTGLIFLPDLGRFGTPEAASFVTCIDGSRGRADATLGSSRRVLTMPLCPAQAKCDGFTGRSRGRAATRLCLCKITAPVLLRGQSLGVSPKTALRNALIGATNCV
jgi:hypothetical protein